MTPNPDDYVTLIRKNSPYAELRRAFDMIRGWVNGSFTTLAILSALAGLTFLISERNGSGAIPVAIGFVIFLGAPVLCLICAWLIHRVLDIALMVMDFFDSQLLDKACRYQDRIGMTRPTAPESNKKPSNPEVV